MWDVPCMFNFYNFFRLIKYNEEEEKKLKTILLNTPVLYKISCPFGWVIETQEQSVVQ